MISNKIFNSVISQILYILVSSVIGFMLIPMLLGMLGKTEYGIFELILSLIIVDLFLEFGMGSTLIKYIPEYKYDMLSLRKFVWSYFYIKLFLSCVGFFSVLFIGYNFDTIFNLGQPIQIDLIKISVYLFAFGIFLNSVSSFIINILNGFIYFGLANLSRAFSLILFFIVLYSYKTFYSEYSILTIAVIWFIIRPLFLIIFSVFALHYVKLLSILCPEKFEYKYIQKTLRYMFGMTYIVMVAQLYNKLPKIILGILLSPIYVAYWGIMEKVKEPLLQLQSSMLRPLVPILSDTKSTNIFSSRKIFQAVRLQYVFISFIALLGILHIKVFIEYWIGSEFELVSSLIQIWLLPFLFPNSGIFLMMYYAEGKTKINSMYITINTFLSLSIASIGLFLLKDMKIFVLTFSIVIVCMTTIVLWVYLRYYKVQVGLFIKKAIVRPILIIVSYLMIYSYMYSFFSFDLYGLFESIIFSLLLYGFLFFIFMPKEDFQLIFKLIKKGKTI